MDNDYKDLAKRAKRLLDALDRMHGRTSLSLNVCEARDDLRRLIPRTTSKRDLTREAA